MDCGNQAGFRKARGVILDRVAAVLAAAPPVSGRPVVTLSWAQTLNAAIAERRGVSTPISSRESLLLTHELRSLHDGILVGIGTVRADDSLLSVRLVDGRQPRPIVLDSSLRLPPESRLMKRSDLKPWIFHSMNTACGEELTSRGARIFAVGRTGEGLNLEEVLTVLAREGVRSLMVEGGAEVLQSFLREGLAGQAVITISPVFMGGLTVFQSGAAPPRIGLDPTAWEMLGRDLVIWGKIGS
jgi:riboflavin-specific deaminase-like protein